MNELPAILELSRDLGSTYAAFLPIIPVGRASGGALLPPAGELLEALCSLRDTANSLGFRASLWCAPFVPLSGSSKHFRVHGCPSGKAFDILPDGTVPVCDTLRMKVSDVRKGVKEAWYDYLRHPLVRKLDEAPGECRDCPQRNVCRGGCRARAYALTSSLEAPDPLCPRVATQAFQRS